MVMYVRQHILFCIWSISENITHKQRATDSKTEVSPNHIKNTHRYPHMHYPILLIPVISYEDIEQVNQKTLEPR